MKKDIQTRKNEHVLVTSNIDEMHGKYLAENLLRTWSEEFLDEDNGEIVTMERSEFVLHAGTYLDEEQLSMIAFHLQAGDIKEIKVSDQKRLGLLTDNYRLTPWQVTVQQKKKLNYICFAKNITQAVEIVIDYVELHYDGKFAVLAAKGFKDYIFLDEDELEEEETTDNRPTEEVPERPKLYYAIDAMVTLDPEAGDISYQFLVSAKDADDAKRQIEEWSQEEIRKRAERNQTDLMTMAVAMESMKVITVSASPIKCAAVIYLDFSLEYAPEFKKADKEAGQESADEPQQEEVAQ